MAPPVWRVPQPGLAGQGGNVGGGGTAYTREARRAVDGVEEVPDMSQANSWDERVRGNTARRDTSHSDDQFVVCCGAS